MCRGFPLYHIISYYYSSAPCAIAHQGKLLHAALYNESYSNAPSLQLFVARGQTFLYGKCRPNTLPFIQSYYCMARHSHCNCVRLRKCHDVIKYLTNVSEHFWYILQPLKQQQHMDWRPFKHFKHAGLLWQLSWLIDQGTKIFTEKMAEINEPVVPSQAAYSMDEVHVWTYCNSPAYGLINISLKMLPSSPNYYITVITHTYFLKEAMLSQEPTQCLPLLLTACMLDSALGISSCMKMSGGQRTKPIFGQAILSSLSLSIDNLHTSICCSKICLFGHSRKYTSLQDSYNVKGRKIIYW